MHEELDKDWSTQHCPPSDDEIHCRCWWNGDGCCICDAPPMTDEEKKEQGMIDLVKPTPRAKDELERLGVKT